MEENISIKDLLFKKFDNKKLVIPAIQRKYVWNEKKICDFFESIMREYPIGQMLIWNINGEFINKGEISFYYFLDEFDEKNDKYNQDISKVESKEEFHAILDGQQRIQSLIIGLKGSYSTKKKSGKKNLYINLSNVKKANYENEEIYEDDYSDDSDDEKIYDDYEYKYDFKFLYDWEVKDSEDAWYKVQNILTVNDSRGIRNQINELNKLKDDEERDMAKDILNTLFVRINEKNILSIKNVPDFSSKDILEIFIRTNSGGEKLSKSDLLFSTVVSQWNEGRNIIDNFLREINDKSSPLNFKFTNDFIMRTFLYIEGAEEDKDLTMKIENFGYIARNVKDDWDDISEAIKKTVKKLRSRGFSDKTIRSNNSIIPIVYYFYNGGSSKKEDLDEIEKYIIVSQLNQIYGTASNTALKATRTALKGKKNFRLSDFKDMQKLPGNKSFIPTEEDLKAWMNYKKGSMYSWVLLKILYDDIDMAKQQFHQDHVHPKKIIDEQNDKDISKLRDTIPNLELLTGTENDEKLASPLKEWCQKNPKNKVKYINKNTSLDIEDFKNFYDTRYKNMIKDLKSKFNI